MVIWDRDFGLGSDPFSDLARFRNTMNRLFSSAMPLGAQGLFPPVNVWSNNEKAVVTAEVPGVNKEDMDISVENDALTVKGHREHVEIGDDESFRKRERGYGSFRRVIGLPYAVDPENVNAEYKDGILRVELHRHEASKPRKIDIS